LIITSTCRAGIPLGKKAGKKALTSTVFLGFSVFFFFFIETLGANDIYESSAVSYTMYRRRRRRFLKSPCPVKVTSSKMTGTF